MADPATEALDTLPDAALLRRFAATREEPVFAELVRRHGRLVWGVCRRRLARREDAEDAFQATFLILAVKAGSIRAGEALPGWLHRTACRASIRVASSPRSALREEVPAPGLDALAELARREAAVAVDEELVRLPGRYRDPLVLFHLEGLERRDVAARLGLTEPAVKALLARGRSLLRTRLARRGFALPMLLPFAADPLPAEAAATAIRLAASFASAGLSPFDLVPSPAKGWTPMLTSLPGKATAAALAGALGLTIFFTATGPANDGASGAAKSATPDTILTAKAANDAPGVPVAAAEEPKREEEAAAGVPPSPERLQEERTLQALSEEAALDFPPETTLKQALDLLARRHRLAIGPVEEDQPLKLDAIDPALKKGRLESVLRALLQPLGLTYAIDERGVLRVTTPRSLIQFVQDRSYDVAALRKRLGDKARIDKMVSERLATTPAVATGSRDLKSDTPPEVAQFGDRLLVKAAWIDQARVAQVLRDLRREYAVGEQSAGAAISRRSRSSPSQAEARIAAALDSETRLEFPNTPLRQAINFLAQLHEINIIIDEKALADGGVNIDDNIDLVLSGITLRSALKIMLEPLDLTYVIEDEVMKITTKEIAARDVDTRAYKVAPLLDGPDADKSKLVETITKLLETKPPAASRPKEDAGEPLPPPPRPQIVLFKDRLLVTASWADHKRITEILRLMTAEP